MSLPGRVRRLITLLPLLWVTEPVRANEGVPALLQFAEQYRSELPPPAAELPAVAKPQTPPRQAKPVAGAERQRNELSLRQSLKARDAQVAKQQAAIRVLEKQLASVRGELAQIKQSPAATPSDKAQGAMVPADFTPLMQLVGRLRDAAGGRPETQRAAELIKEARADMKRGQAELASSQAQVRALKLQLNEMKKQQRADGSDVAQSQKAYQVLQTELTEKTQAQKTLRQQLEAETAQRKALDEEKALQAKTLSDLKAQLEKLDATRNAQHADIVKKDAELTALRSEKQALQKQHDELQRGASESDTRLAALEQEHLHLQEDAKQLRERAKYLVKPEALKQPTGRQTYAAGAALGRDILEMLDERKAWGVHADRQTILAGVIDAFTGQYQLTTDVLDKALAESEVVVNQAREKAGTTQQKKGEAFVAGFKKQKGTLQSPSGFWYRVGHVGDSPIAADAIVDVVVKESLTDGTVIQDMDLGGKVLSQPLEAYPPLFREAIGYLRNHGSVTLVVPPELAYGEAGYPPKIPPHATMIYELRVEDVKAPEGK